jgi:hypothetical protein
MSDHSLTALSKHEFPPCPSTSEDSVMPDGSFVEHERALPFVLMQREGTGDNLLAASLRTSLILRTTYRTKAPLERQGFVRLTISDEKKSRPTQVEVDYDAYYRVAKSACEAVRQIQDSGKVQPCARLSLPLTPKVMLTLQSPGYRMDLNSPVLVEFGLATPRDYYQIHSPIRLFRVFVELCHSKDSKLVDRLDERLRFIEHDSQRAPSRR